MLQARLQGAKMRLDISSTICLLDQKIALTYSAKITYGGNSNLENSRCLLSLSLSNQDNLIVRHLYGYTNDLLQRITATQEFH